MLWASVAYSQSLTVICGGDSNEGNGSFSYSCGQVFYNIIGHNITLSEGVQQPFEIYEYEDDIIDDEFSDISLSVYPNPTGNFLFLNVDGGDRVLDEDLECALFDGDGRLIRQNYIGEGENFLDVQTLVPAAYYLSVIYGGKKIKTFKVIKN